MSLATDLFPASPYTSTAIEERDERIANAEHQLNAAYDELTLCDLNVERLKDDLRRAQTKANAAQRKCDAAHEASRLAYRWEPPTPAPSIFKDTKSERPTVDGSSVQDTGGNPDARTSE